jgi:hypothetical protein
MLFAIPVISCLVLVCLSPYASYSHDFGIPGFVFVALTVFGSIFLWKWRRKSISVGWLACWIWFSFVKLAAQYSAPLWYHPDSWGYTFAFEQSLPVAGIAGALFFWLHFFLGESPSSRAIP